MSNSLASIDFATEQMPGPHLHQTLRRLREQHPVSQARFAGLPAFVISGHAELAEAFRDNQRFPPANAYRFIFEFNNRWCNKIYSFGYNCITWSNCKSPSFFHHRKWILIV